MNPNITDSIASISDSIVYTDVIPDSTITNENATSTYDLDLDNDGIYDFTFYIHGSTSIRQGAECGRMGRSALVWVTPAKETLNEIIVPGDPFLDFPNPVALDSLTVIGSAGSEWSSGPLGVLRAAADACYLIEDGNWDTDNDKFLGLKLIKGPIVFYGWVKLNIKVSVVPPQGEPGAHLIVREYAYNRNSNKPILAGQRK
jgi:hypothetical protein